MRTTPRRGASAPVETLSCLSLVSAEEAVVLSPGTPWQIPWELLMLGPFVDCLLDDGGQMRHVTAGALLCSAARRSTAPGWPLEANDYDPLPMFPSEMSLLDAARLIVETRWEFAVVMDREPKLITPRAVLRSLLDISGSGCREQPGRSAVLVPRSKRRAD